MNKNEMLEFLKKCDSELDSYGKHLFFSIDSGLQRNSDVALDEMVERVSSVLDISQEQNFETLSNLLTGFICHVRSMQFELRAYLHMKDGDMSAAWNAIVDARGASYAAIRADSMYSDVCKTRNKQNKRNFLQIDMWAGGRTQPIAILARVVYQEVEISVGLHCWVVLHVTIG